MDSIYIIENFFLNLKKETAARLNIMMSPQELIKAVKDNSILYIEKTCLSQYHWHAFYPLITENKWKVVDSEWANTSYHYNQNPVFLNVKLYKEWVQDKDAYYKNHPNTYFNEDSTGYDGMGDIVCCSQNINFKKDSIYVKDGHLATDCIAIKIYDSETLYDICCASDSSSNSAPQRNLRATFILQPTNKTKKERQEIIIEMFRDIITYRLATIKVQKYIDNLVPKLAKKISST